MKARRTHGRAIARVAMTSAKAFACAMCGAPATMTCGGCAGFAYCAEACLRSHCIRHAEACARVARGRAEPPLFAHDVDALAWWRVAVVHVDEGLATACDALGACHGVGAFDASARVSAGCRSGRSRAARPPARRSKALHPYASSAAVASPNAFDRSGTDSREHGWTCTRISARRVSRAPLAAPGRGKACRPVLQRRCRLKKRSLERSNERCLPVRTRFRRDDLKDF